MPDTHSVLLGSTEILPRSTQQKLAFLIFGKNRNLSVCFD